MFLPRSTRQAGVSQCHFVSNVFPLSTENFLGRVRATADIPSPRLPMLTGTNFSQCLSWKEARASIREANFSTSNFAGPAGVVWPETTVAAHAFDASLLYAVWSI
jgi:hypothetical protein